MRNQMNTITIKKGQKLKIPSREKEMKEIVSALNESKLSPKIERRGFFQY